MAHSQDDLAYQLLYEQFSFMFKNLYKDVKRRNAGFEFDEAMQIARIVLHRCISTYREDRHIQFHNYVRICVMREYVNFLKKGRIYRGEYLPPDYYLQQSLNDLDEIYLEDVALSDENLTAKRNDIQLIIEIILDSFSYDRQACQIFQMRLQQYSYKEIAQALNISTKVVDNTIQKIRKKIPSLID